MHPDSSFHTRNVKKTVNYTKEFSGETPSGSVINQGTSLKCQLIKVCVSVCVSYEVLAHTEADVHLLVHFIVWFWGLTQMLNSQQH